ncbi:MAG: alpha/beta hydrolase fold domain-containing protein [Verrucomicrobiota bacterium]
MNFSACLTAATVFGLVFSPAAARCAEAAAPRPAPPGQRAQGPGGSDYAHESWRQSLHGEGGTSYWLFEPVGPVPAAAPLVVFLHGWAAIDPWLYGAWVEHLVRRGNVVLFPRYQSTLFSDPSDFLANTIQAVRDGMKELAQGSHVRLKPGQVAYVGHSMGGVLSADLAACAETEHLPRPKAVMCVQPGGTRREPGGLGLDLLDLRTIPAGTLLLSVAGDRDSVVGDQDAVRIFQSAGHLPAADRNLVYFVSDEHGSPPLRGNHYAPCSPPCGFCAAPGDPPSGAFPTRLKAMLGVAMGDFVPLRNLLQTPHGHEWMHSRNYSPVYAETFHAPDSTDFDHWRLFDALCEAAFTGKNRSIALGDTPAQRDRGQWSDGTPVKELRIVTGK